MPKKLIPHFPRWYYGPNKGDEKVCNSIQDIPYGWQQRKPTEWKPVSPLSVDKDVVIAELTRRNIHIDPTWGKAHLKKVLDDSSPSR